MRPLEPSDIGHLHECCDGRDCAHVQAQILAEMIADIAPQAGQRAMFLRIVGAVDDDFLWLAHAVSLS